MRPSEYDAAKVAKATRLSRPVARLARPGATTSALPAPLLVVTPSGERFAVTTFDATGTVKQDSTIVGKNTWQRLEDSIFGSEVQTSRLVFPDEATLRALHAKAKIHAPRFADALIISMALPVNYHVNILPRALDRKYYAPRGTDTQSTRGWANAFGVPFTKLPEAVAELWGHVTRHRFGHGFFGMWDVNAFNYESALLDFLTGGRSLTGDIIGMRNATNLTTWWDVSVRADLLGRRRAVTDGSVMHVECMGNGTFRALGPVTTRSGKRLVSLPADQPTDTEMLGTGYSLNVTNVTADNDGNVKIVGIAKGEARLVKGREYLLTEQPYFNRGARMDRRQNKWLDASPAALSPAWRDVPMAVSLAGTPEDEE